MDTTNPKIRRAEKILNSLVTRNCITDDARLWLIAASDPFHDIPERVAGYPDTITTASVVQVFKKTMTINRPPVIPAGNAWDCLVYMHQIDGICNITHGSLSNANTLTYDPLQLLTTFGGVVAYAVPSGAPMSITQSIGQIALDTSIITSGLPFRTIAKGFETTNTTAELFKQGSVVLCSVPNQDPYSNNGTWNLNAPGGTIGTGLFFTGVASGPLLGSPPSNASQAMLMPYARQWDAAKGNYSVATMCSQTNQPNDLSPQFLVIKDSANITPQPYYIPQGGLDATNNNVSAAQFWPVGPFNSPCAYFTGLSSETSLTVTAKWVIERFPSFEDTDLVTMATPSPEYCAEAIEAYSHCMRSMPVAVPKDDNDLGDYIASFADLLAPFFGVPPVGKTIKRGYDIADRALSSFQKDMRTVEADRNWGDTSGFSTNVQPNNVQSRTYAQGKAKGKAKQQKKQAKKIAKTNPANQRKS